MTRHDIQSLLSILTNHIDAYILTDAFYLITSNGQTDYLLISDVFLAESWILLAKKNTLSEQFPNQTEKPQKEVKLVPITHTCIYITAHFPGLLQVFE